MHQYENHEEKTALGCSFTGHRTIAQRHKKKLPELLDRAIRYAYDEGCRVFYTGGAIGFDTEAARRVLLFRVGKPDVKLILLLPCLTQAACWSVSERAAYEDILSSADEVIYINEEYSSSCMRERNLALATRAHLMIAYLGHMRSGAGQTVNMAKKLGKRIYNLYPALEQ